MRSDKDKYYMTTFICRVWKNDANKLIYGKTDRLTDVRNKLMVTKEDGGRKRN